MTLRVNNAAETGLKADSCDGEGRSESTEVRTYQCSVQLISDSPGQDTITEARAFLRANSKMPWYGREWNYGTKRDPFATCRSVKIRRNLNTFDVSATFSSEAEKKDEKPDEEGNPTDDPTKWRTELDIRYSQTAMAIDSAKFIGFSRPVNNNRLFPGRVGPIVNSAMQPLDVQHMKEVDTQTIRCTFYRAEWEQAEAQKFIGKVNSNPVLVLMPKLGFRANYPARTLKVREYGGRSEVANRKAFWSITIEVIYKPDGWLLEVLDTGFGTIVAPGEPKLPHRVGAIDPDPDSEAWESTTWSAPVIERMGNTPIEQAVDQNGNPIAVAGFLNGQGQMLPAGQDPVYLKYQIYDEVSFATLFALASA